MFFFTSSAYGMPAAAAATSPASVRPRFEYWNRVSGTYKALCSLTRASICAAVGKSDGVFQYG